MSFSSFVPLAATVAGSLLSKGGSRQGGTVTQTSSSEPWGPSQEYLKDIFSRGQSLLGAGSPYTQAAQNMQAGLAMSPMKLVPGAQDELLKTIQGGYLGQQNPYLQAAQDASVNRALGAASSRFGGESFGASPSREWMTRAATEAIAPFNYGAYENERARQFGALQMAPGLESASYIPTQQLYQAGEAPWMELARYRGLLTGVPGGTTTSQTPYYENPWANMLGGALGGMQLGKEIQKNWPWPGGIDYGGAPPMTPGGGA